MLRLKCKYEDDIRRISLDDVSFEVLCLALLDIYSFRTTHIKVRYLDDQDDLVTISSTEELEEAVRILGDRGQDILRIVVNPEEELALSDSLLWLRQSKNLRQSHSQATEPIETKLLQAHMPHKDVVNPLLSSPPPHLPFLLDGPLTPLPLPDPDPTLLVAASRSEGTLSERLQLISNNIKEDSEKLSDSAFASAREASDSIKDSILAMKTIEFEGFQQSLVENALISSRILDDIHRITQSTLALTIAPKQQEGEANQAHLEQQRVNRKQCDDLSDDIRDKCSALSDSTRVDSLREADLIASQIKSM